MTCNQRFNQLLDDWWNSDSPRQRDTLSRQAEAEFGQERTVLAMDMSGFSSHTRQHGPMPFLALIRRLRLIVPPVITAHAGQVVKFNADNCMAHFPTPGAAVQAAFEIMTTTDVPAPDDSAVPAIRLAMGLATGPIFVLPDDRPQSTEPNAMPRPDGGDIFGNAVNQAFRFGEDLAQAGEILLSPETAEILAGQIETRAIKRAYNADIMTVHRLVAPPVQP